MLIAPPGQAAYAGPADAEVAWLIQLHHSKSDLPHCLARLRKHYPQSRVVLIADGDGECYLEVVRSYQCEYLPGEHLMTLRTGHLYVLRLLRTFLAGPERYLIRLDPDAWVWRRFVGLPAFSSVFGTVETISEHQRDEILGVPNIQGGCLGITRDAAEAIATSGLLSFYRCGLCSALTWARCRDMQLVASKGRVSDDFVITWAAGELGIPIVHWPEIRSRWRLTPSNPSLQFAVTHPHKRGGGLSGLDA